MTSLSDLYTIDEESGAMWRLLLGDSCERLAELPDESVDLSVYSPPFASLFTYSPSPRDLGNSASRTEFFEHYGYIIRENYRVTKPGRICAVHCQQLTTTMSSNGVIGVTDFRGEIIRAYVDAGWILHGEVTIDKDPQAQAIRTKAQALMFVTKNRDSSMTRPALADYIADPAEKAELAGEIFGHVAAGRIKIEINQRYELKDAVQAHRDLESRKTTGSSIFVI